MAILGSLRSCGLTTCSCRAWRRGCASPYDHYADIAGRRWIKVFSWLARSWRKLHFATPLLGAFGFGVDVLGSACCHGIYLGVCAHRLHTSDNVLRLAHIHYLLCGRIALQRSSNGIY